MFLIYNKITLVYSVSVIVPLQATDNFFSLIG